MYFIKKLIPLSFYKKITRPYHYILAFFSAVLYGFPSRDMFVIGVTGTKGKSTTVELINAILEEAGRTTALSSTIRFKIGKASKSNLFKMTMPGRFFLQKFLRNAKRAGCTYVILEMTSEGVMQYRHKWIFLDMLVFTNIAPEHIESHGSFKNYLKAKLQLRELLKNSPKKKKWTVANTDDKHGKDFLNVPGAEQLPFSLKDAEPYINAKRGVLVTVNGESIHSPLLGVFNIYNLLAAITVGKSQNISLTKIKRALENHGLIPGRAEKIEAGQSFAVVVDYAHTPDSLLKLYTSFNDVYKNGRKICVLGNAGGGRDRWKRKEMGKIADNCCNTVFLTNEDPYDEDPQAIVIEMANAMKKHKPEIIMDRREAIRTALSRAEKNDVVLITGKGTDPFIMGPRGTKQPWSDKAVATEEIKKLLQKETL